MLTLIAASDPALRAALADAIATAGHDALCATDGAAAWAEYRRHRPRLLVVDIDLATGAPDAPDALALCRLVHAQTPGGVPNGGSADGSASAEGAASGEAGDDAPTPFVIVTVPRDGAADVQAALAAGADDYFTTPPSARNVAARLAIAERRMETKAARQRAERALARARWVAGIGETSIALQHEINNPLAALLGHAALLEQGLVAPGEERELLQIVVEQAQRIATVMKRLAALRDPRSVEYFGVARMLDLSPTPPPGGSPPVPNALPPNALPPNALPPNAPPARE